MVVCLLVLLAMHSVGLPIYAQVSDEFTHPPTGSISDSRIAELSGIVPATELHGYWVHNDNGHDPVLFRFSNQGDVLQTVVLNAENVDWEAMTNDDSGQMFIADTGDNNRERSDYQIYQFREPSEDDKIVSPDRIRFQYEDQKSHDCEAVFRMGSKLYLITKTITAERPMLFSLHLEETQEILTAHAVGPFVVSDESALTNIITDASYSPQRKQLAVLTYVGILFYSVETEASLLQPPTHYHPAIFGQSEAICFDHHELIVTNERGNFWLNPISFYNPFTSIWQFLLH